jgi:hypothetical protein
VQLVFSPDSTNYRLGQANLSRTDLCGADLSMADLFSAQGVTNEQLELEVGSRFLAGTTIPDGQWYNDWHVQRLIDKEGREEDGEHSNTS